MTKPARVRQNDEALKLQAEFAAITVIPAIGAMIDTTSLFDATHSDPKMSPIDQLIQNTNKVNLLYLGVSPVSQEMGTLVLLGYVSAVESFIRALVRGLINVDAPSQLAASHKLVTFGAALHHARDLLPEALLEDYSLAKPDRVAEVFKDFADIRGIKGTPPAALKPHLENFGRICELRHCCVHRFGKLGVKNALELGLHRHSAVLEKPLKLNDQNLEDISFALRNFAKALNNYIFEFVMKRSTQSDFAGPRWEWMWSKDKKRFSSYYELFSSSLDAVPSKDAKAIYETFKSGYQSPVRKKG